jgi:ABC-type multidrug transport system fused ATPase/permease subunit
MERFYHIYMFEDGQIVLEGNHQELIRNAKYQQHVQNYISG